MRTVSEAAPRSYLFVPGNRPERFAESLSAAADVVVIDLEDGVPATEKRKARQHLRALLAQGAEVFVRINALGSRWFTEDLKLLATANIKGVVVPKVESTAAISKVHRALNAVPIIAQIESALGLWQAFSLAQAPGVRRLAFGRLDYLRDSGHEYSCETLPYVRAQIVLASRIFGLDAPIDGVNLEFDDYWTVRTNAVQGKFLGFGGKLCLNAGQVEIVNSVFSSEPASC